MVNNGALQIVRLIRQKNGETICINKSSFWFGKEAGNVDYCITDNTAISRRHALITIRNNECYIPDNHSTNRVFLNGHVLEPGTDTLLSDGDRVRIIGDQIMYFNHEDIAKVVFEGYTDDDDKMMVDNINEWYRNSDFDRVNVTEWNKKRRGESGDVK